MNTSSVILQEVVVAGVSVKALIDSGPLLRVVADDGTKSIM